MKLVVGLGNPGREYEATRHNAGFWWVENLADMHRVRLQTEPKFFGRVGKLGTGPNDGWLLLPQTFMNASGRAVQALAGFYKIAPGEILVVHDELDLKPGEAKLKLGGGVAGHNGLRDIQAQLGSPDFWRLRIGIGHPRDSALPQQAVVDYVLKPPRPEELWAIDAALDRALDAWPDLARGDMERAMQDLHTRAPDTRESKT